MKEKNVDFIIDECRAAMRQALLSDGHADYEIAPLIGKFNKLIKDEYKFILRGKS